MRAICISRFAEKLTVKKAPIPKLQHGKCEIIVKQHFSPINPSDFYNYYGKYGYKI